MRVDKALGDHILLDLYDVNPLILNDKSFIEDALIQSALNSKCTIVGKITFGYHPYGISGVLLVAESHISLHTWPEYRFAAVDIFTCGRRTKPELAKDKIVELMQTENFTTRKISRGTDAIANLGDSSVEEKCVMWIYSEDLEDLRLENKKLRKRIRMLEEIVKKKAQSK